MHSEFFIVITVNKCHNKSRVFPSINNVCCCSSHYLVSFLRDQFDNEQKDLNKSHHCGAHKKTKRPSDIANYCSERNCVYFNVSHNPALKHGRILDKDVHVSRTGITRLFLTRGIFKIVVGAAVFTLVRRLVP